MTETLTLESGVTITLPETLTAEKVVGMDQSGRYVIDPFNAREEAFVPWGPDDFKTYVSHPYVFALTICCNASDKGTEDGVVCRGCYGVKSDDTGDYIYKAEDGTFPGLDAKVGWLV